MVSADEMDIAMSIANVLYAHSKPTGCNCSRDPWRARVDGCPEHGLQPLTDHVQNLRVAVKRGDLSKLLPRMTSDEVAAAERGIPESMRSAVRAAWKAMR